MIRGFILCFMLISLFLNLGSAFGPSTPYWKDNPLYLGPGEETFFNITLQNLVGSDDVTLRASLGDSEVARLIDGDPYDYLIPFGRDDIKVPVGVKVESGARDGDRYEVGINFIEVKEASSGTVGFAVASIISFPVIVRSPEFSPDGSRESFVEKGFAFKTFLLSLLFVLISVVVMVPIYLRIRRNRKGY